MVRFDPIMKDHLNRVERGTASHNSYLGHHVQNELIDFNNSGLHPRYKPHRTVVSGH